MAPEIRMRPALAAIAAAVAACGAPVAPGGVASEPATPERSTAESPGGPPVGEGATAPNLVAVGRGVVLLTWIEAAGDSRRVRMARWSSGRWSAARTIIDSASLMVDASDVPAVTQGEDGALVAYWPERSATGAAYDVVLGRSRDGGATWTRLGTPHAAGPAEHGFVSLVTRQKDVLALWLDGRAVSAGGSTELRAADVGDRLAPDRLVDERVCDCCPTAAVMSERGPVIFYRDRARDEVRDIAWVRWLGDRFSEPAAVHRDGWKIDGCPVNGPAAAADGDRLAVAWYTEADGAARVQIAFSSDGGATMGPVIMVDRATASRTPLGRVGVALDPAGDALVTWTAAAGDDAQVLVRRIARDGRRGAERWIGRTAKGRTGGIPRIARVADGVLIAWMEADGQAARLRATALADRDVAAAVAAPPVRTAAIAGVGAATGKRAPTYAVTTADGQPVDLAGQRGKAVLLNVWATWCEPCKKEMPILRRLHEKHAAGGLSVVAVSVDGAESADAVRSYVAKHKLPFTIWLDPEDRASTVLAARALPVTLLVDKDGVVRFRRDGRLEKNDRELEEAIERALR